MTDLILRVGNRFQKPGLKYTILKLGHTKVFVRIENTNTQNIWTEWTPTEMFLDSDMEQL